MTKSKTQQRTYENGMSKGYELGRKYALKEVLELIDKYIKATKHDIKFENEDEQQELMSLYLLHELKRLKIDINKLRS